MKWPLAAAPTRAGIADALATITPALLTHGRGGPPAAVLRAALYGHAFNPARADTDPGPPATPALGWASDHCLPLTALADAAVTRRALDALALRLDGTWAAATTITRKRAVFHGCLSYAAELGLLAANPPDRITWKPRRSSFAARPARPRRCGSASRWQTSVTASDGMTRRDQFSRRNSAQRPCSRSAALNAATSGPVSHKITLTQPRRPPHDRHKSGTCHDCGPGPPGPAGNQSARTDVLARQAASQAQPFRHPGACPRSYRQSRARIAALQCTASSATRAIAIAPCSAGARPTESWPYGLAAPSAQPAAAITDRAAIHVAAAIGGYR